MEIRKGKIGINSAFMIYTIMIFSPAVRVFGNYCTIEAKQAAWLCPIVAGIVIAYLSSKLNSLLLNHPGLSLLEIYEKVLGKILAKILAVVYLIWTLQVLIGNAKLYTMRLSTSLYPNIDENLFLIVALIIIGIYLVKSGLVVLARMSTMFFWIVFIGFMLLTSIMLANVKIDRLTPISYLDIIPILKGSVAIIATWSYMTLLFLLSDDIIGFKFFKKRSLHTIAFLVFFTVSLLVSIIGSSGHHLISKAAYPYLIAVEQLILLNSITGVEAILVVLWILSDFVLISMFTLFILKIIEYIFHVENTIIYANILLIMLFYLVNIKADNYYMIIEFAAKYVYPINIVLFVFIPILIGWLYKVRSKARKAIAKMGRED